MLGWAKVSRAHLVDDGGLSDWATSGITARVPCCRPSNKGPGGAPITDSVIGNKEYLPQDRQLSNQGIWA